MTYDDCLEQLLKENGFVTAKMLFEAVRAMNVSVVNVSIIECYLSSHPQLKTSSITTQKGNKIYIKRGVWSTIKHWWLVFRWYQGATYG